MQVIVPDGAAREPSSVVGARAATKKRATAPAAMFASALAHAPPAGGAAAHAPSPPPGAATTKTPPSALAGAHVTVTVSLASGGAGKVMVSGARRKGHAATAMVAAEPAAPLAVAPALVTGQPRARVGTAQPSRLKTQVPASAGAADAVAVAEDDAVAEAVTGKEAAAEVEALREAEGGSDGTAFELTRIDSVNEVDAVEDVLVIVVAVAVADGDSDAGAVVRAVAEAVGDAVAIVTEAVGDAVAAMLVIDVGLLVVLAVRQRNAVGETVAVVEKLPVTDEVMGAVVDAFAEAVIMAVGNTVADAIALALAPGVKVERDVALVETQRESVGETELVIDRLAFAVTVSAAVAV